MACEANGILGACTNLILAEMAWFVSDNLLVSMCNNKNLLEYDGNIRGFFPIKKKKKKAW